MDVLEMATQVAAEMGWNVSPGEIEMKEVSGKGGAKTFLVSTPAQPPVALHVRCATDTPVTMRRLEAVQALFAEHGMTPRRIHDAGDWYLEEWGGTTLLVPDMDTVPAEGVGWTPAELGILLAKVHRLPTGWFDEFRKEYCEVMPALRAAGPANLVWRWHTLGTVQALQVWSSKLGIPIEQLKDCRCNIGHFNELLVEHLNLSQERLAEWVECGESRMQWRNPAASRIVTIHGDFWQHNIVRAPDGALKVIDLEMAGVLPAAVDVMYSTSCFDSTPTPVTDCLAFVRAYLEELGEDTADAAVEDFMVDGMCWWAGSNQMMWDIIEVPTGTPSTDAFAELVKPEVMPEEMRQDILGSPWAFSPGEHCIQNEVWKILKGTLPDAKASYPKLAAVMEKRGI